MAALSESVLTSQRSTPQDLGRLDGMVNEEADGIHERAAIRIAPSIRIVLNTVSLLLGRVH
jgi:hypothetical protein